MDRGEEPRASFGRARAKIDIQLRVGDVDAKVSGVESLDGVFTDPPYYGMVQYGELPDAQFCYVWLRKLDGERFRVEGTGDDKDRGGADRN